MIATVNGKGNENSAEFRGIFLLTDACSTMSRWNGGKTVITWVDE